MECNCSINVGRSIIVGKRPMKSLTSVSLSVCVSTLTFLKIELFIFSDIVHDDSWPWYLVIEEARFLKKIFRNLNLGLTGLNQVQNEVFRHFLEFELLVFLEIAYNYRLQQCLTSNLGQSHVKIFENQNLAPHEPNWSPKLGFSPFSEVWLFSFPWNCIQW